MNTLKNSNTLKDLMNFYNCNEDTKVLIAEKTSSGKTKYLPMALDGMFKNIFCKEIDGEDAILLVGYSEELQTKYEDGEVK